MSGAKRNHSLARPQEPCGQSEKSPKGLGYLSVVQLYRMTSSSEVYVQRVFLL